MHVTSSQLVASEVFPVPVTKALLYPGATINGLIQNKTIPGWNDILDIYNLTSIKEASAVTDLQRLEVRSLCWLHVILCIKWASIHSLDIIASHTGLYSILWVFST